MTGLLVSLLAGLGVFYLYTAVVLGWIGVQPGPAPTTSRQDIQRDINRWLVQAGLEGVELSQFVAAVGVLFGLGAAVAFMIFGGLVPALLFGTFLATTPVASHRLRRQRHRERSHQAWPRMIDEIRVMTGSAGRSVPQALLEVGRRSPEAMQPAFDAAHREWLLTTDFDRTLEALKSRLADPTADVTCETLLIAHQLGGTDLEDRLTALAEDRLIDIQGRKDATARQAGARFARWFTVVVPIGMALVGMSIGDGRSAYRTDYGQVLVVGAITLMIACWAWATRIMKLPEEQRVFPERAAQ
jgi:tight adherence protein B